MTTENTALTLRNQPQIVGADDLEDEAAGYASASRSPNTVRAYRSDWADFVSFCSEQDRPSLPASPQTVALYITARARTMKTSSIRRRLSSIAQAHSLAGLPSPTRESPVRLVWDGIKRTHGTAPDQKAPAIASDIRSMLASLPLSVKTTGAARDRLLSRDRALLLIGFAGGFRRSELTALTIDDVVFNARGAVITIRRSKTDQEGAGRSIGIAPQPDPVVCPVRALKAWLKLSGIDQGPLFRAISRHGHIATEALSPYAVALVVKRAAAAAGLEEDKYAGHSLRSGFATAAAEAGASDRAIMKQTGHRSREMVDRYVRSAKLFDDNASALIRI